MLSRRIRPIVSWGLIVVVAFAIRLIRVFTDQRMIWPDESYQSVEVAHRLVFGFGVLRWEYVEGTRSYLGPALLTPALWLADRLGVASGAGLITTARITVALVATTSVVSAGALASRLHGRAAALPAAVLVACSPLMITYDTHTFLDTLAAPLVLGAFALALTGAAPDGRWPIAAPLTGGILGALAVALRPQAAVLLVALVGVTWITSRRAAIPCALGAAAATLAWGALDAATWGSWFASTIRSVRFNLVEDGASIWGTQPASFYVTTFAHTQGAIHCAATGLGLAVLLLAIRRRPSIAPGGPVSAATIGLLIGVAGYLITITAVGHKELRFALPAVPLLLTLAAIGLTRLGSTRLGATRLGATRLVGSTRVGSVTARRVVIALLMVSGVAHVRTVDAIDLGGTSQQGLAGANAAVVTAALSAAGQLPGTCGVALIGYSLTWSGALTALHRDVTLIEADAAGTRDITWPPNTVNTVIAPASVRFGPEWVRRWSTDDKPRVVVVQARRACAPAPRPAPAKPPVTSGRATSERVTRPLAPARAPGPAAPR